MAASQTPNGAPVRQHDPDPASSRAGIRPFDPASLNQRAFRRLLASGAFLALRPDAAAAEFEVFTPRNAFAAPLGDVSAADVAAAQRAGLLAPLAGEAMRLALTRRGVAAIRARLSTPDAATNANAAVGRNARASDRPAPGTPTARPAAAVDRDLASPLAWLRRRRDKDGTPLITDAQFNAGERLGADFMRGQMMPRVTVNWDAFGASGGRTQRGGPGDAVELKDSIAAAQTRVRRALDAVGPELAGILIDVCCFAKGLEQAEQALHLPQRSGKIVLQLALTGLARHYGLIPPVNPLAARQLHWGTDDYRPTLDQWHGNR